MSKIKKILIANRGEVVNRIIKTCKDLNIETVSIFSEADKECDFINNSDYSYFIGGSNVLESYTNIDKIIEIAKISGSDAIHPGYGFLSENYEFAKKCNENNIIFIGPDSQIIEKAGDKIYARNIALSCNVPVVPGISSINENDIKDIEKLNEIIKESDKIEYPLIIKASAGGGGKGIRVIDSSDKIHEGLISSQREAAASFKNSDLLVEKYFEAAKHIEVQIIGDNFGNILHLGDRNCSIQRRYQKIIEETPTTSISEELKTDIYNAALKIAKSLKYNSAGTIEFIVNSDFNFYFLEINTRLQVEHPITETSLNIDIIKMQIEIAENKSLNIKQEDINNLEKLHSIECRLYAENTNNNFNPSNGYLKILDKQLCEIKNLDEISDFNIRIDSGFKSGDYINIFYDPMIAKIISYGKDRYSAINKMINILESFHITGLYNNKNLLLNTMKNEIFLEGNYDTSFIENEFSNLNLKQDESINSIILIKALIVNIKKRQELNSPLKGINFGWRNLFYQNQKESFILQDKKYEIEYKFINNDTFECFYENRSYKVNVISKKENKIICLINNSKYTYYADFNNNESINLVDNKGYERVYINNKFNIKKEELKDGNYYSPLPGEISKIHVKSGDKIKEGQNLITIFSMKMETTICSLINGTVKEIFVNEKMFTDSGSLLIKIDPKFIKNN